MGPFPDASRAARTAARAPGSTTPTIGTGDIAASASSASAVAVLHATTSALTSRESRSSTALVAYRRTVSGDFVP